MGKAKTIHSVSGKLEPLIYYEMNGKQYVRTAPTKVRQPNTAAQLGNKRRFGLATTLASQIYKQFETWFIETDDVSKRAYNQLQSSIQKTGIKGTAPDLEYDWDSMVLTTGTAVQPEFSYADSVLTWSVLDDKKAIKDLVIVVGIETETLTIKKWIDLQNKGKLLFPIEDGFVYYVFRTYSKNGKVFVSSSVKVDFEKVY